MRKFFVAGTDEEIQFGEKIGVTLVKEIEEGKVTVEKEVELNPVTAEWLMKMGYVEVDDECCESNAPEDNGESDEALEEFYSSEPDLPCSLLLQVMEKLSSLEKRANKMNKRLKTLEKMLKPA